MLPSRAISENIITTKMPSDLFGLELVFTAVGRDFKRKDDALIALAHWIAVKNGFQSIGLGNDKTLTGTEVGSELLPAGWNQTETYAIRYLRGGELFILRGVRTDGTLILNLLRTSDLNVSNVALDIEEAVKSLTGSLKEIIPDYQDLAFRFRRELLEPVTKETRQEVTTQTPATPPESSEKVDDPSSSFPVGVPNRRDPLNDPLSVRRPPMRPFVDPHSGVPVGDPMSPFNVGHNDLDPLGGGGMLFNPFAGPSRRNFPGRGRIPGARFDPPGPLPRPGGFDPDTDHLPPPGYDDIYM